MTYGANLMGAGSGGFILGVLRDGCSREMALEAVRSLTSFFLKLICFYIKEEKKLFVAMHGALL